MYQAIQEDPNLANELGLSQTDVQALEKGQTPEGYTWHHSEEPGVLQLVDEKLMHKLDIQVVANYGVVGVNIANYESNNWNSTLYFCRVLFGYL